MNEDKALAHNPLGAVLGVWAHPDDESFTAAGLMMRALRADDQVCCLTVTRGEGSRLNGQRGRPPAEVAKIRETELRAAVKVIGVFNLVILDYRADQFPVIDENEAISKIAAVIEETAADSVLTHNGNASEMPHHRIVCSWVSHAFRRAAKPTARLLCATRTREWVKRFVPPLREAGAFPLFEPSTTPRGDLAVNYVLPDDQLELKLEAIEKHKSQVSFVLERVDRALFREAMREEHFVEVTPS